MHKVGVGIAIAMVMVALSACSSGPEAGSPRMPVAIDTDVGSDDVMAILYLLSRPDVDVRAITVSGTGLVHCEPGVRTVLGLLEVAGSGDVPVACGRETPLGGSNAFPQDWRAAADGAFGLDLPIPSRAADERSAPEVLTSAIRGADPPVTLITLGPLTNVAEALTAEPELVGDLAGIVSMGGALLAGGNVEDNPEAEWNFHADPLAVDVVLRSGAPITLVPLDATNSVPITAYFVDALAGHHVTPAADTVLELLQANPYLVEPGNFFWDPLAGVLATEGSSAAFEERRVVVLQGSPDVDGELLLSSAGVTVRAAMQADAMAFETEYLNTLNGDDAISSTRPEPDLTITLTADGCESQIPDTIPPGPIDVEVQNPLTVGGAAILATTKGNHSIDELAAFVRGVDAAEDARPPRWVVSEAWTDAPVGGSALAPWVLTPGAHAVVCVVQGTAVVLADTIQVSG